jgi:hypothetical protein
MTVLAVGLFSSVEKSFIVSKRKGESWHWTFAGSFFLLNALTQALPHRG